MKMKIEDRYSKELSDIKSLIKDLKDGRIYELEKKRGFPKCETLANKITEELDSLIEKIDKDEPGFFNEEFQKIDKKV